jgi:hypothetical protein
MITLQIAVRMPAIVDLLVDRGWLTEETDDPDVIGKALSAALAAWLANPGRDPFTLPVKDQQTESTQ